jgi:hypothetical protein
MATTASWVTAARVHRASCQQCAGAPMLVVQAGTQMPSASEPDLPRPVQLFIDRRHVEARRMPESA